MSNKPYISIIVPVYNGERTLNECIDSLINLEYPKDKLEIIIVDNNSTDSTRNIIERYPVICALETKVGSYAARNKGIYISKGEIQLFTDSDCVVDKYWAQNIIKKFNDTSVGLIGGKVITYNPTSIVERYLESISSLDNETSIKSRKPSVVTANAAIRKQILVEIGFFDDSFTSGGDYDVSWRIHQKGHVIAYEPTAIVYHNHKTDFKSLAMKEFRYGYGNVQLLKKHSDNNRFRFGTYVNIIFAFVQVLYRLIAVLFVKKDKMLYLATPVCDIIRGISYKLGMIYGCIKNKTVYL